MAKRTKREIRFSHLSMFAKQWLNNMFDQEDEQNRKKAVANIQYSGHKLYPSEVDKFFESNPDLANQKTEVEDLFNEAGAISTKESSTGEGKGGKRLNTPEKARELGVKEELIDNYIQAVNGVFKMQTYLNSICPLGRASFAIPLKKLKAESGSGTEAALA